jgi:FtsZ-binding cell division protein ZapB
MTTRKKTTEQMLLSGTEEEIFKRLHERVEKAMAMIQDLRRERDALKAKLEGGGNLEEECDRLRKERNEIRNRIETILSNLESLDV